MSFEVFFSMSLIRLVSLTCFLLNFRRCLIVPVGELQLVIGPSSLTMTRCPVLLCLVCLRLIRIGRVSTSRRLVLLVLVNWHRRKVGVQSRWLRTAWTNPTLPPPTLKVALSLANLSNRFILLEVLVTLTRFTLYGCLRFRKLNRFVAKSRSLIRTHLTPTIRVMYCSDPLRLLMNLTCRKISRWTIRCVRRALFCPVVFRVRTQLFVCRTCPARLVLTRK